MGVYDRHYPYDQILLMVFWPKVDFCGCQMPLFTRYLVGEPPGPPALVRILPIGDFTNHRYI